MVAGGAQAERNLARATWHLRRSEPTADASTVELCVTPRKNNLGPVGPAVAFAVTFGEDRTTLRTIDAATVEDFAPKLPLWQRMRATLRQRGAMTAAALAESLGADAFAVYKAAARDKGRTFVRFDGPDGVQQIGLKDIGHVS